MRYLFVVLLLLFGYVKEPGIEPAPSQEASERPKSQPTAVKKVPIKKVVYRHVLTDDVLAFFSENEAAASRVFSGAPVALRGLVESVQLQDGFLVLTISGGESGVACTFPRQWNEALEKLRKEDHVLVVGTVKYVGSKLDMAAVGLLPADDEFPYGGLKEFREFCLARHRAAFNALDEKEKALQAKRARLIKARQPFDDVTDELIRIVAPKIMHEFMRDDAQQHLTADSAK